MEIFVSRFSISLLNIINKITKYHVDDCQVVDGYSSEYFRKKLKREETTDSNVIEST